MKIAYFGESPADMAAMSVFVDGMLGTFAEPIATNLKPRTMPALFGALEGIIRGAYFNTDAEGLVVVVDGDESEIHKPDHDIDDADVGNCRFCKLRSIVQQVQSQLRLMPEKPALKIAIGVAVPAIEAWYLVGRDHQIGEATWVAGQRPYTKVQLKKHVYGSDRPSLEMATQRGVEEARRIIADIGRIEREFPMGFGLMAAEIRSWRTPVAG